jgi:hypothetical protein
MSDKDESCLSFDPNRFMSENKDLLWGAAAVAAFLNEISASPISRSQVYHWLDAGLLPSGKFGGKIVASKRAIQARFEQITGTEG